VTHRGGAVGGANRLGETVDAPLGNLRGDGRHGGRKEYQ
jgi:hypothetical protein